jgi:hypothetical protein
MALRAYFCSGSDEVNAYRLTRGVSQRSEYLQANDNTKKNMGTYHLLRIVDRCKTEGCGGGIEINNQCFAVALPKYATNCHPLYGRKAWDKEIYTNYSGPNHFSTLDGSDHVGWQGRNYVDDGKGYLAGRMIVKKVSCNDLNEENSERFISSLAVNIPESSSGWGMEAHPMDYSILFPTRNHHFIEAPYSLQHQVWGFTCPEISKIKGYKANPKYDTLWAHSGWDRELEDEAARTYKKFLKIARDQLARDIARDKYGKMYPNPFGTGSRQTATERETSEAVVNSWAILNWAMDKVDWPCSGFSCLSDFNPFVRSDMSLMACRDMADASLVEYQDDENRLCIKPYISHDCHSKRPMEANPHFNVSGTHPDGNGNCLLSYGLWKAGGIYDRLYQQDKGKELYVVTLQPSGEKEIRARTARGLPADGYAPFMTARMAHQLCHAYFIREKDTNHMENWPSPEALWEEGLCVQAEAIVHTNLCSLGYCPTNFDMKKTDFIRSLAYEAPAANVERGVRFAYPHEYRGHDEIFLGSYLNNMTNIAKTLFAKKPQEARMMSILHAFVPILDPPKKMTVDGIASDFQFRPIEHEGTTFRIPNLNEVRQETFEPYQEALQDSPPYNPTESQSDDILDVPPPKRIPFQMRGGKKAK